VKWPAGTHPAFHAGIKDLAVGDATVDAGGAPTAGYLFEGASLTIEGMCATPSDPTKEKENVIAFLKHVDIARIKLVRDYRVMFDPGTGKGQPAAAGTDLAPAALPSPDPRRLFSHVEMRTQRWRFSGRPIYRWIEPLGASKKKFDKSLDDGFPVIELESDDNVTAFEAELFFDRDDADCEFTRVRLTGGRDELLDCPWELPSATYFRHAFNFVSRYAGAMQPGKGPLWPSRQADWSHRVAVLADAPRLEVTRPQMRCIVPLTTSPDDVEPAQAAPDLEGRLLAPTAPVACILEERPFAVGGLAERMLTLARLRDGEAVASPA
jgi:hypothetical protein